MGWTQGKENLVLSMALGVRGCGQRTRKPSSASRRAAYSEGVLEKLKPQEGKWEGKDNSWEYWSPLTQASLTSSLFLQQYLILIKSMSSHPTPPHPTRPSLLPDHRLTQNCRSFATTVCPSLWILFGHSYISYLFLSNFIAYFQHWETDSPREPPQDIWCAGEGNIPQYGEVSGLGEDAQTPDSQQSSTPSQAPGSSCFLPHHQFPFSFWWFDSIHLFESSEIPSWPHYNDWRQCKHSLLEGGS